MGRRFDGQKFWEYKAYRKKGTAKNTAKKVRKQGYNARVVKSKFVNGKIAWVVYKSWKRSKL